MGFNIFSFSERNFPNLAHTTNQAQEVQVIKLVRRIVKLLQKISIT